MRKRIVLSAVFALLSCVPVVSAQKNNDVVPQKREKRTLSGCLTAGDDAQEYHLNADDGAVWNLHGGNSNLASNANHWVAVSGVISSVEKGSPDPHSTMHGARGMAVGGDLDVRSVKKLKDACPK